jgi:hypothetical protein
VVVSHAHLTQEFPRFCPMYRFQGDIADLAARMQDLHTRMRARQRADALQGSCAPSRETLLDLCTGLDQYIVAMCGGLAVNLVHSVLSSPPR